MDKNLNEIEKKMYELIRQGKKNKDLCNELNLELYEMKQIKYTLCKKLNVISFRDIIKNNTDTLNLYRQKKERKKREYKRKQINELQCKKGMILYRFMRSLGYSAIYSNKNRQKAKVRELIEKNNIEVSDEVRNILYE
jgi:hypothetical protein